LFSDLRLQHPNVWNVERNCNLGSSHGSVLSSAIKRMLTILPQYPFSRVTPNLDNCHIA
jgi:hypothetical protein